MKVSMEYKYHAQYVLFMNENKFYILWDLEIPSFKFFFQLVPDPQTYIIMMLLTVRCFSFRHPLLESIYYPSIDNHSSFFIDARALSSEQPEVLLTSLLCVYSDVVKIHLKEHEFAFLKWELDFIITQLFLFCA